MCRDALYLIIEKIEKEKLSVEIKAMSSKLKEFYALVFLIDGANLFSDRSGIEKKIQKHQALAKNYAEEYVGILRKIKQNNIHRSGTRIKIKK